MGCLERTHKLAVTTLDALCLCVLPWGGFVAALVAFESSDSALPLAASAWLVPVALAQVGLLRLYASFGVRALWSLFYLPGALFVTALLARATLRALRGAGTSWHGVRYPTTPS